MTPEQIRAKFPNASEAFIRANLQPGHTGTVAKLEPSPCHEPLEAPQVQAADSGRFLVRVTAFRRRLLDIDNQAEKFHTDLCRYAGVIPNDNPERTDIEVKQVKVGSKEKEFTRVEVFKI